MPSCIIKIVQIVFYHLEWYLPYNCSEIQIWITFHLIVNLVFMDVHSESFTWFRVLFLILTLWALSPIICLEPYCPQNVICLEPQYPKCFLLGTIMPPSLYYLLGTIMPPSLLFAWNHNTPNIFLLGTIMPPNIFPVDKNFTAQDDHSIRIL